VRGHGRSQGASRPPHPSRAAPASPQGERRFQRASPDAPLLDLAMRFSFLASKISPPLPTPLHSPHLRPSWKGASLKRRLVTWGGVQKLPTVRTHVLSVRLGPATCWNAGCEERAETSVVCQKSCAGRSGGRTTKTNSSGSFAAPPPSRYCARARKKKGDRDRAAGVHRRLYRSHSSVARSVPRHRCTMDPGHPGLRRGRLARDDMCWHGAEVHLLQCRCAERT
jgi:hypothetical protein